MRIGRRLAGVGMTIGGMMLIGLAPVYGETAPAPEADQQVVKSTAPEAAASSAVETDAAASLSPLARVAAPLQDVEAALTALADELPPVVCDEPGVPNPLCGDEGDPGEGDPGEGDPGGSDPGDGGGDLDPCALNPDLPECGDPGDDEPGDPGDDLCLVDPGLCPTEPGEDDPGNNGGSGSNGGNNGNGNGGNPGNGSGGNSGNGSGGNNSGGDVEAGQGSYDGAAQAEGSVPGTSMATPQPDVVGCTDPALCNNVVLGVDESAAATSTRGAARSQALPETGSSSSSGPLTAVGAAMLLGGVLLLRRSRLRGPHRV